MLRNVEQFANWEAGPWPTFGEELVSRPIPNLDDGVARIRLNPNRLVQTNIDQMGRAHDFFRFSAELKRDDFKALLSNGVALIHQRAEGDYRYPATELSGIGPVMDWYDRGLFQVAVAVKTRKVAYEFLGNEAHIECETEIDYKESFPAIFVDNTTLVGDYKIEKIISVVRKIYFG